MHSPRPAQPALVTALKGAAFWTAVLLAVAVAVRVTAALDARTFPLALLGAFAGYLAADLLSGIVHWCCDTFFDEETPLVGRLVIAPFRHHHRDPAAITGYRLLEQDATAAFLVLPPLGMALASGGPTAAMPLAIVFHAALCALAAGMLLTNLFHKWAHLPAPSGVVVWLQRHRLVLSPALHDRHHQTHTRAYCVTTGWLNRPLDRMNAFGRLARTIRRVRRGRTIRRARA